MPDAEVQCLFGYCNLNELLLLDVWGSWTLASAFESSVRFAHLIIK
jgi:hypothetical protein